MNENESQGNRAGNCIFYGKNKNKNLTNAFFEI